MNKTFLFNGLQLKFSNDIFLSYAINFIISSKSFLLIPILTLLSKWEFGIYNQFKLILTLFAPYLSLGLSLSIIRFMDEKHDFERLVTTSVIIACTSIPLLILPWVFDFSYLIFGTTIKEFNWLIIIWLISFTFDQLLFNFLLGKRKFSCLLYIKLCNFFIELIGCYLIIKIFGSLRPVIIFLIISTIGTLLFQLLNTKMSSLAIIDLKRMLQYSIPILIGSSFGFILNSGDRFIIIHLLDAKKLGEYAAVYSVANLILVLLQPLEFVLYPKIAHLWNKNMLIDIVKLVKKTLKYEFFFGLVILLIIFSFKDFFIATITNKSYLSSKNLIFPLVSGLFIFSLGVPFQRIVTFKHPNYFLTISLFTGCINLILNFYLIPVYGILASAWLTFLTNVIWSGLYFILSLNIIRVL